MRVLGEKHILFDELAEIILRRHKGSDRPGTYVATRTPINHLLKIFSGRPIYTISKDAFWHEYIPKLREQGVTRNLNNERKLFIQVLYLAYHQGLVPRPPTQIPKPSPESDKGRELTKPEIKRLFDKCTNDTLRFQMEMGLKTGMRENEMLALKWEYIDFEKGTISLPGTITKTRKGRRFPVCPALLDCLKRRHEKIGGAYVFPIRGKPGKRRYVNRRLWRKLRAEANVRCRWHDLRHTCATHMLRAGNSKEFVAKFLGMSEKVLMRIYAHITEDDLRPCATAVNLDFLKEG